MAAHVFVASASYSARSFGVRGGMLLSEAQRLCPELIVLDVTPAGVEEMGDALFDLFHEFTAAVEPGSVEEAFLDIGTDDWNVAIPMAQLLRQRSATELGIPVTVGVGRTKLMAKLASRAGKPDGLHVIRLEDESLLRRDLRPADVWGIGAKTLARLKILGVTRLADLDRVPDAELQQSCGKAMATRLGGIRNGTDDATVQPQRGRTCFTSEGSTAGYARADWTPIALLEACLERVCRRAERAGLVGSRLTLTLRPEHSARPLILHLTCADATSQLRTWLPVAVDLLKSDPIPPLIGLSVTLAGLIPVEQLQDTLF